METIATGFGVFGTGAVAAVQHACDSALMDSVAHFIHVVDGVPIIAIVLVIVALVEGKMGSVDMSAVVREGAVLVGNLFVNQVFKFAFRQPRPYEEDPSVYVVSGTGYGFPSAAVQVATLLALQYAMPRWGARVVAGVAVFVTIARMYAGVHYLHDCIGGAAIGVGVYAVLQS